ncbi:hypothetical protein [Parasitella parasitica]|uniref:Pyridine nucleotide-disulphide oxidoreductase N-terminal domain-containing protein n=1 Tax=Parasitella parasitica TaxID=35722 RepID=A0A0B7NEF0_9FUNG|nr:hypothetical protein [Parasitella parasitica]
MREQSVNCGNVIETKTITNFNTSKQTLVVIGSGDSAADEASYLTKYTSHVHVLVRRDQLRASKFMADRLLAHPHVTVHFETVPVECVGDASGLCHAIGHTPVTELIKGQVDLDETGYIKTVPGSSLKSFEGSFAAGNVQDKRYRQAITSAGSGCMAALDAERYLTELHN